MLQSHRLGLFCSGGFQFAVEFLSFSFEFRRNDSLFQQNIKFYMKIAHFLFFLGLISLSTNCKNIDKKDLATVEKQELASSKRNDDLFQGLHFGMTTEQFFAHCWQKNREKVFAQAGNMKVDYDLTHDECKLPVKINFFPEFSQDKIYEITAKCTYINNDYFNPEMKTDKLLIDVKTLMEKWFKADFFLTSLSSGRNGYANISGNRKIIIKVEKDYEVMVVFTDLMAN
jgi:hypothetical protein